MAATSVSWPVKTRELHNVLFDSTRWNGFKFRDDDIIVATWGKSGTTWTQQILGQLIFRGAEGLPVMDLCPWLDLRLIPLNDLLGQLDKQTHRRFLKTHLPLDALEFSPKAKYVYIGRDGRDSAWSWYNHYTAINDEAFDMFNNVPGRVGPPAEPMKCDIVEFFRAWIDGDGFPLADFWSHYQGWYNVRHLPNVLLVHFNNLKADVIPAL